MQDKNMNDIFDKYLTDKIEEKVEQPKEEHKQEVVVKQEQQVQVDTPKKASLVERFLTQVVNYAETSGEILDQKTKTLAVDIITGANKVVVGNQYRWNEIDIQGCGLI